MQMQYQRYENYKDSGVPWLGEIPEGWDIQKGKWLFEKADRPVRPEDDVVTAFRDGQVTLRTNRRTDGFTNAIQEHGYQGIRKGDFVIHAMDAFAGAIGVSESDGKSSPVYSACIPRGEFEVSPFYYAYMLRYVALSGYILSLAKGIRQRSTDFRYNDFANMLFPAPSIQEQDRIVAFLDAKVGEVEAAIEKKQRLIELLEEQKAILINNAVTKGLNPDASIKDSGIDWIGEIPAHWEVKKGVYLFKIYSGLAPDGLKLDDSGKYGYIKVADLNNGESGTYIERSIERVNCKSTTVLPKDTIIFPKRGGAIFTNKVRVLKIPSLIDTNIMGVRTNEKALAFYICYIIRSLSLEKLADISSVPQINNKHIGPLKFPLPTTEEQKEIVSYISRLEDQYGALILKTETAIHKLQEFKQTLIAHAVTGKIRI